MNVKSTATDTVADGNSNGSGPHQSVSKSVVRTKDRLLLDLKTAIDDAQALMKEAAESSTEYAAEVPAYFENKIDMVKGSLHQARTSIERTTKRATVATDRYVKENPWKSMGYVTAASLVVGVLLMNAWHLGASVTRKAEK